MKSKLGLDVPDRVEFIKCDEDCYVIVGDDGEALPVVAFMVQLWDDGDIAVAVVSHKRVA